MIPVIRTLKSSSILSKSRSSRKFLKNKYNTSIKTTTWINSNKLYLNNNNIGTLSFRQMYSSNANEATSETRYRTKNGKRIYTREEVGKHDSETDCWVIIGEKVYNITSWIDYHPGGRDILLKGAGKDISIDFYDVKHSFQALEVLETLHIGYVETPRRYDMMGDRIYGNEDD